MAASRPSNPVEPPGAIGRLGINEMRRATSKSVCAYWQPSRLNQVRARFDDHDLTAGPCDVESKLVCLHTEVVIGSLNARPPDRSRAAAVGFCPARGSRQVIDRGVVVEIEGVKVSIWGITLEVNRCQIRAEEERLGPNQGDAFRDQHASQGNTFIKGLLRDAGDASQNIDVG